MQSALSAAEELKAKYPDRKVNIVDSLSASLGEGLLSIRRPQAKGDGPRLPYELVEENKLRFGHWFTVEDWFI